MYLITLYGKYSIYVLLVDADPSNPLADIAFAAANDPKIRAHIFRKFQEKYGAYLPSEYQQYNFIIETITEGPYWSELTYCKLTSGEGIDYDRI